MRQPRNLRAAAQKQRRRMRQRLAPTAIRIAISFSREWSSTNSRLVTLRQAISRTAATMPKIRSREVRTLPTVFSSSETTLTFQPRLLSG